MVGTHPDVDAFEVSTLSAILPSTVGLPMWNGSISCLADAYIGLYTQGAGRAVSFEDPNRWAWEEFERLVNELPCKAWRAVLAVTERTDDVFTLGMLAAGPLEDLLELHGPAVVERIEREAQTNAKFRRVLQGVWRSSTPDVWARIEVARGRLSDG